MHGVNSGHIDSLHSNIAKAVRQATGASFKIVSPNHPREWKAVPPDTEIVFELGTTSSPQPDILVDYIDRELGGRAFGFRLIEQPEEEPTLWAGWYEQWKSAENETFD